MLACVLVFLTVGSLADGDRALASVPDEERPDVVIVLTDDQRWDSVGTMPFTRRALVGPGVSFAEAFVVNPLCCPSRASLLTGLYSHSTNVYRQVAPYGRLEWFEDSSTIATWLDDAGYDTGYFGKYIDGGQSYLTKGFVPPGWDRWAAFVHAEYYDYGLSIDGTIRSHGHEPEDYSTDVLADEAAAFLRSADAPAFAVLAVAAPHAPGTPAPRHADAPVPAWDRPPSFDEADISDKPPWVRTLPRLGDEGARAIEAARADQLRSLRAVDDAIRRLVQVQRERGRLRDTVFILTSDNGLLWGEHRWTKKEAPYEESIRVPLVIRYDRLAEPHVERRMALNIDIAPTIAELAGVRTPHVEGTSLVPLIRGTSVDWREDFLVEHLEGANPVTTYCAVRTERHLYVEYRDGSTEFFDLRRDPHQMESTHGGALARSLAERLDELCDPPPPDTPPITRTGGQAPDPGTDPTVPIALGAVLLTAGGGLFIQRWRKGRRTAG